jgi:Domain of unknown function (DUF4034)
MKIIGHHWAGTLIGAALFLFDTGPLTATENPALPADTSASSQEQESESTDALDSNVRTFRTEVRSLFNQGKYTELNALAEQLRKQRLRFNGGAWRLHVLYVTVGSPGSTTVTDAEWRAHIAAIERWINVDPNAPTARIALARTYLEFAWKARGNGFANTVTPEGWQLFRERVQKARTVLDEAAKLGSRCPEWYRQMQTVALAQQWNPTQYEALADKALADEPDYFYFAVAQANYLLPKWYGKPGDTESYAGEVADKVGGSEGDAVYFQIAAALNCCKRAQASAMSWPRVQRGFAALEQLYGSTNYQRNVMAFLALRAGDEQSAQQAFQRIGNNWNQNVWKSKERFDASRTGQTIAATKPITTVTDDVVVVHTATP